MFIKQEEYKAAAHVGTVEMRQLINRWDVQSQGLRSMILYQWVNATGSTQS